MAKQSRRKDVRQPGGGFSRGLFLGLAVAAGVQLYHAGIPDWMGSVAGQPEPGSVTDGGNDPLRTNFDFYRFLPEAEVLVDEADETPPSPATPPAETRPRPSPSQGSPAEPAAATLPSPAASPSQGPPAESVAATPPSPAAPPVARPPASPNQAPPAEPAATTFSSGTVSFRVQVGSFRQMTEADRLRASLTLSGFDPTIDTRNTAEGTWHRVTLGPFKGRAAAERAKTRIRASRGIEAQILLEEI